MRNKFNPVTKPKGGAGQVPTMAQQIAAKLQHGFDLHSAGQLERASAVYQAILQIDPRNFDALQLLGTIAAQTRRWTAAVDLYARALLIDKTADLFYNQGIAFQELRRLDEALSSYGKAIGLNRDFAEAYLNQGNVLRDVEHLIEALTSYDKAIDLKENYPTAHFNRGVLLQQLRRFDEALVSYDRAIALRGDYAEAYANRGAVLHVLRRLDDALTSYTEAIAIKPDYAEAYANRGVALKEMGHLDEALRNCDKAIDLKADYAEAHSNRGNVLQELRRLDEAIASYAKAIAINPLNADAHWNQALTHLIGGEYQKGWLLHEWRWKTKSSPKGGRVFAQPLWLGQENLHNKTILLHAEQGLGDSLQFCRYAKLVKDQGAHVLLEVPAALVSLLSSLSGVDQVITFGEALPDFDYHCPLMSLPLALGTELASIPFSTSYLRAEDVKVGYWRNKMRGFGRLKVGLVWSGGFRANQPVAHERRNITLDIFARALNTVNADFFSLQKGDPAESAIRGREQEYWPQGNFYNYVSELQDFSDTAALIENLDLVVSVDTSTAHLSAALGKPTWILNRFDTCWRWLLDRDDSPWYQSVKLYRQSEDRQWEPVLKRLADDLSLLDESQ
jgi:tetratricopeptide (TPR) repeat protein